MSDETIFALSSGGPRAGVAVVRLSGPGAAGALSHLTGAAPPAARRMSRATFCDPISGETIDQGLAVWFPAPASFTGEDVVEFHVHGGRAVVGAVLDALAAIPALRVAEPGEFTRRAFEHGKLDLTAAEGLADLINAETEAQRRQALRQMEGELGRLYGGWHGVLVGLVARLEATIDFSDEDLPGDLEEDVRRDVLGLDAAIAAHVRDDRRGERLRDGVHLAIIGPPNAGKSSLLNLLARRDAAIVAETAGTTRDIIEIHLDLGGYPLVIADTAGLRATVSRVEDEGVRRALRRARDADLKLAVFDGAIWPETDGRTAEFVDARTIVVVNKVDLGRPPPPLAVAGRPALPVSALTGEGIEELLAVLEGEVASCCPSSAAPLLTRTRHRAALEECRGALARYLEAGAAELAAEDLRLAARALGCITGRVDVEDILDVIFRDFCIGK
ncbi:MAG TPA: tRNA uridine-5-carboxymethylaminomethyl(34) synthesis GTPase MnmE [Rhodospirillales bacterium]|nr:tRNA uridine-5-carboxymethylaminomethyl(34) synthesis GTPase MnmE [Rhodospirillales bacterium]